MPVRQGIWEMEKERKNRYYFFGIYRLVDGYTQACFPEIPEITSKRESSYQLAGSYRPGYMGLHLGMQEIF